MATHFSILALENPMDKGAWQAIGHSVAQSWTRLKWLSTLLYCYRIIYLQLISCICLWVLQTCYTSSLLTLMLFTLLENPQGTIILHQTSRSYLVSLFSPSENSIRHSLFTFKTSIIFLFIIAVSSNPSSRPLLDH